MRLCEDLLRVVFPHLDGVLVERVHRVEEAVEVSARTRADGALPCPDCGVASRRAHSRYRRRIADTAVGGKRFAVFPVAGGFRRRCVACSRLPRFLVSAAGGSGTGGGWRGGCG